jgi:hypothetical protein
MILYSNPDDVTVAVRTAGLDRSDPGTLLGVDGVIRYFMTPKTKHRIAQYFWWVPGRGLLWCSCFKSA